MTGEARPLAYRAEVRAEGLVYGTGQNAPWLLSRYQTLSPRLALRWLQGEALRIADRLDPDPVRSAWVPLTMRAASAPVPDCPAELRMWATDPEEQDAARGHIRAGEAWSTVFPDVDTRYGLSVWPLWHSAELSRPTPATPWLRTTAYARTPAHIT